MQIWGHLQLGYKSQKNHCRSKRNNTTRSHAACRPGACRPGRSIWEQDAEGMVFYGQISSEVRTFLRRCSIAPVPSEVGTFLDPTDVPTFAWKFRSKTTRRSPQPMSPSGATVKPGSLSLHPAGSTGWSYTLPNTNKVPKSVVVW